MARTRRSMAGTALALFVAASVGCGKAPPPLAPPDAPTVSIQNPRLRSYAPTKEFNGRLVTKDPVKVVPQVSGMITRRAFKEGDMVQRPLRLFGVTIRPGSVLFEIDVTQFEADLKKAKADIARAEADIKNWIAQIKLAEAEFARADESLQEGRRVQDRLRQGGRERGRGEGPARRGEGRRKCRPSRPRRRPPRTSGTAPSSPRPRPAGQALVAEKSIVDAYKTELVEVYPIDPIYAVAEVDELTSLWYRDQIYEKKEIPNPRNESTPLRCWITLQERPDVPAARPARAAGRLHRPDPRPRHRHPHRPGHLPEPGRPAVGRRLGPGDGRRRPAAARCSPFPRRRCSPSSGSGTSTSPPPPPRATRPSCGRSSPARRSTASWSSRRG